MSKTFITPTNENRQAFSYSHTHAENASNAHTHRMSNRDENQQTTNSQTQVPKPTISENGTITVRELNAQFSSSFLINKTDENKINYKNKNVSLQIENKTFCTKSNKEQDPRNGKQQLKDKDETKETHEKNVPNLTTSNNKTKQKDKISNNPQVPQTHEKRSELQANKASKKVEEPETVTTPTKHPYQQTKSKKSYDKYMKPQRTKILMQVNPKN
ncbi:MATH and LRR domain-containing protein PFE0570w-like [Ctenocephalides felis]|uniref:MATH and LRR domain-containing protein PFE0570w-like n=1 Tax=Ctenocephalides felis TaxID=7515 RepID=UPI000E6E2503|nr:MATH and LRR domain-containing protein PFE0570w-like [Ctenocephalides felis]